VIAAKINKQLIARDFRTRGVSTLVLALE